MKFYLFILIPVILTTSIAHANNTQHGFSGELGLLATYREQTNNVSTNSLSTIAETNNSGDSFTTGDLLSLAAIRYRLNKHVFFAEQSEDTFVRGILAIELGYGYQINQDSQVSIGFAPTVARGRVWQNPYLTKAERSETNIKGNAYRLKYENSFLNSNFAYYDRNVESEGSQYTALNRNGDGYFGQTAIILPLSSHIFIEPILFFQRDNATGNAMAYDKLGAGLSTTFLYNNYSMFIHGRFAKSDFDAINPLFNSVRKDENLNLTLTLVEEGALNINSLSFIAQVSYHETNSNISFYSKEDLAFFLGFSHQF
ncbi:surface lipoprotein assembly modifier [Pseudomonas sp. HK3]